MAIVRVHGAPVLPNQQAVAVVFAPPRSVSPEQSAPPPAAGPEQPFPAEIPALSELTVAQPSPPDPLPAEAKSAYASPPIATPPAVHKTITRVKPVAPAQIAETPVAIQPPPADVPPSPTASRSPFAEAPSVAEAPIAGEWQRSLAAWLAAHKTYPEEARRSGSEGNVALRLTIDRSGRVLDVVLVRSAGSPTLDGAAEAMVRNAVLPPFTAGMAQDTVTITIRLRYALAN